MYPIFLYFLALQLNEKNEHGFILLHISSQFWKNKKHGPREPKLIKDVGLVPSFDGEVLCDMQQISISAPSDQK